MKELFIESLIIILLVLLNALFATAELAVVTAKKSRLRRESEKGGKSAKLVLQLIEQPGAFLSTVQIGITLIGIGAGVYGGATIASTLAIYISFIPALLPYAQEISYTIVILVITYLSLVIGELVPKRLALAYPETIAKTLAPPLVVVSRLVSPFVKLLDLSTNLLARLLPVNLNKKDSLSEEDIMSALREGSRTGILLKKEGEILSRVMRLDQHKSITRMTPRADVAWLDLAANIEEQFEQLAASGVSRFPVAKEALDHILGIINLKDLFDVHYHRANLESRIKSVMMIPSTLPLLNLLEKFQQSADDFAVLINEHGGVDGIITLHDVFEAVVGELRAPDESPSIINRADGSILASGSVPITDISQLLKIKFQQTDFEKFSSLGGFVINELGHIPSEGEHFDYGDFRFEVMDMDGNRVDKVLIIPLSL